jgi:TonB-dependent starch-binding outer membrane protein SusC
MTLLCRSLPKGAGIRLLLLLFLLPLCTLAQSQEITGTVKDSTGRPLAGVSVSIKGKNLVTITRSSGTFIIPGQTGETLVFSGVSLEDQQVLIGSNTTIEVIMRTSATVMSDVVVVGYGKSSRRNLASAITSVKSDDLNRGSISDVGQLLQGKVPGLNITASGDPNKTSAVILRGSSTLNSSQSPFYVIDNIPGADISAIAPDDIVSIDVLKDAAATAIYGNRAANGVIMVTTKRGKKGPGQLSYSGYVGREQVTNGLDVMNAGELNAFLSKNSMSFSPNDDKGASTDWQKEVQRDNAYSHNHNLSFSGGGDHGTYSASINYFKKEGIILGSDLTRIIARLNLEHYALNDKVKFSLNLTNSNSNANATPNRNVVLLQSVRYLPVSPVFNANGSYFENLSGTNYFNPLALINHAQDNTKYNTLLGNFSTQVKLPFGLTYDLSLSYQNNTSLHGEYYDSYYGTNYNSATFYNNPDPPLTHSVLNFGVNGSALRNTYQNTNKILETFFTWNKKINDHSINAVLGYSWQENVIGDGFQSSSTNFPVDNISYLNLALSNPYAISGYRINFGDPGIYYKTKLISDFARLNYNFREKYLLQASIRRDGGSVFGANNQWGYFPAVGVAWRLIEEDFMKGQNIFSDLKLRASYGVTGNASGFSAFTAQFISGSLGTYYYNGTQVGAYGPTQASNPDLKWEKTATSNIGLDFTLFHGLLNGIVEVYDKKTTGMIYSYDVDPILVPVGYIVANGGSMRNKGIELSLSAMPVKNADFSWTTTINLANNKNEITSLSNPLFPGGDSVRYTQPDGGGQTSSTLQIRKTGKPLGQFFTLDYAGKNAAGVSQYYNASKGLTLAPGIGADYVYAGSPQPKLLMGWANTFKYKAFDLNVFVRGVFGNKIFNATRADLYRPADAQRTNILVDAADELPVDVNSYKYSTRFIESGTYIRLDNATLGYNLTKLGNYIKRIRIYASVNNAFVITKYSGIDPEINQGGLAPGVDANNFYPKTRTMLLGVNVSL